jgi:DNA polymerase III subunit alpha
MNYIPLYLKTENSLLESFIKIDDLIKYALNNNMKYLAIADNNMYGAIEFYNACIKNDIKPIIGYSFKLDTNKLVLYAKNNIGYKNLNKISSKEKITIEDLKKHNEGLVCILNFDSKDNYQLFKNIYSDTYIGYSNDQEKKKLNDQESLYFKKTLFFEKEDSKYYKYLYAIKNSLHIDRIDYSFDNYIDLNTKLINGNNIKILSLFDLKIEKNKDLLPVYNCPNNYDSASYLKELCKIGLKRIFGEKVSKVYIDRLKYELDVINQMGFSNYFLVVWDYVKYAKENNIVVGPGRGSAAGSLVAYCLNITTVDPIKYDLLFERFLNKDRITLPDIDIDFEDTRRDEVINYCINKYGSKKVVGIITFGTLAAKQVIRDLSKTVNLDIKIVDYLAKMIDSKLTLQENFNKNIKLQEYVKQDKQLGILFKVAARLEGLKRHTSVHAAGIVMSKYDLDEVIPIVKNHEGFYTTAYSMEYLEDLGLLKMDFLGLRNLTLLNDVIKELKKDNIKLNIDMIPMDDSKTFEIFKNTNTLGIFQFESEGMKNFLRKFRPNNFEEISAAIALFRPGPMNNIDLYIRRKNKEEKIDYFHPNLKKILEPTYGVIVYQEQIMQIASTMAGYSLSEADLLRRAMSKKKEDILLKEKDKFIKRSIELGYDKQISTTVFDLILKFAAYGFNRAHSVAYSLISYKMAYLKANYPKYFFKSLLTMAIGSETKTKEYIYEIKLNGIEILKPDINLSKEFYSIEEFGIRYPLSNIKNLGTSSVTTIIEERNKGKFIDIFDFVRRVYGKSVNKKTIESLIDASLFNSFGLNHKTLHENLDIILNYAEIASVDTLKPKLKIEKEYEKKYILEKELEIFGFYLTSHPIIEYKIKYPSSISINDVSNYYDKVIEILLFVDDIKEVTTKKNEVMLFVDSSDELNTIDLVLFPKVYKEFSNIKKEDIILVKAKVEKRFDKYQLIAQEVNKVN